MYNIIVCNQERISVESYNFSIKENLKKVFDIHCYVVFPPKERGSYNDKTVVRDIVT